MEGIKRLNLLKRFQVQNHFIGTLNTLVDLEHDDNNIRLPTYPINSYQTAGENISVLCCITVIILKLGAGEILLHATLVRV